jgi:hypothetical protein
MDDKITCDASEEESDEVEEVANNGRKSEPPTKFLSAMEGISSARKYLMRLHVENNMMAALSGTENDSKLFSRK